MKKERPARRWWSRLAGAFAGEPAAARPAAAAPVPRRPAAPSQPVEPGLERFVLKMPKVELHVHLEGALRPASLLSLAKKNGVALPGEDEAGIRRWLRFRDFPHFVEIYHQVCRAFREPDDLRVLVHDFMAEQAIQNVVYSEAHFTVATHARHGLDPEAVRRVLGEAVREEEEHHGVRLRLVPDVVRDDGEASADLTLDWALAGGEDGLVVALGLSGTETAGNEPYRRHFDAARRGGLHTTAHAGETGGPESMRAVVETIEPERIDHGVRAVEDEAWLAEVVDRRLPLTVCPTSNVMLGVAADWESHPFDRLYRGGAHVSVNSDGPQMFGTNLTREYLSLHRVFGYGAPELAGLALAALAQSFLPAAERERLEDDFRRRFRELGERYLGQAVEPSSPASPRADTMGA